MNIKDKIKQIKYNRSSDLEKVLIDVSTTAEKHDTFDYIFYTNGDDVSFMYGKYYKEIKIDINIVHPYFKKHDYDYVINVIKEVFQRTLDLEIDDVFYKSPERMTEKFLYPSIKTQRNEYQKQNTGNKIQSFKSGRKTYL